MGVVGPLKRKENLSPLLTDDDGERSVLESFKVDRLLNLNTTLMKGGVEMVTCLLTMETLH